MVLTMCVAGIERRRRTYYPGGIDGMTVGSRDVVMVLMQFPDGAAWDTTTTAQAAGGMWAQYV